MASVAEIENQASGPKMRKYRGRSHALGFSDVTGYTQSRQPTVQSQHLARQIIARSENLRDQANDRSDFNMHRTASIEDGNRGRMASYHPLSRNTSFRLPRKAKSTRPSKVAGNVSRMSHQRTKEATPTSSCKQSSKSGVPGRRRHIHDAKISVRSPTPTNRRVKHRVSQQSSTSAKKHSVDRPDRVPSAHKGSGKSAGLFSLVFGGPDPPRPEKRITCLTCLSDDIPVNKSAKLACSHRMCHTCLKRIFVMSVTDPQHMPPKCCRSDHIPLKHVEKLFDMKFKIKWNRKYQEYTTKNRIYCPAKGCGEWIKPNHIFVDSRCGRKYGKCSRCKIKVCCICNGKWHSGKPCPKDDDTKTFVEMAREKGWQRCYNCSAMVELKEGCNHMTCRCTAQFCMICGLKWKTCDCPWFNYGAGAGDRLGYINVPQAIRTFANGNEGDLGNHRRYQDELERREQEQRDEILARRLQDLAMGHDFRQPGQTEHGVFDFGNAMAHILNEHFTYTGNAGAAHRGGQAHDIESFRSNTPSPPPERLRLRSRRNRDIQAT